MFLLRVCNPPCNDFKSRAHQWRHLVWDGEWSYMWSWHDWNCWNTQLPIINHLWPNRAPQHLTSGLLTDILGSVEVMDIFQTQRFFLRITVFCVQVDFSLSGEKNKPWMRLITPRRALFSSNCKPSACLVSMDMRYHWRPFQNMLLHKSMKSPLLKIWPWNCSQLLKSNLQGDDVLNGWPTWMTWHLTETVQTMQTHDRNWFLERTKPHIYLQNPFLPPCPFKKRNDRNHCPLKIYLGFEKKK